jgi:hypothetical protein
MTRVETLPRTTPTPLRQRLNIRGHTRLSRSPRYIMHLNRSSYSICHMVSSNSRWQLFSNRRSGPGIRHAFKTLRVRVSVQIRQASRALKQLPTIIRETRTGSSAILPFSNSSSLSVSCFYESNSSISEKKK